MTRMSLFAFATALVMAAAPALPQGANVAFGGLKHDSRLPVELTADSLAIDQAAGTATATGNVLAGQGGLRIKTETLLVEYETRDGKVTGQVTRMTASGNVTLSNGGEAAEAQKAVYSVADGMVRMTGDVLLTQGQNALSGEQLVINLNTGQAQIKGRVRTIFQPAAE